MKARRFVSEGVFGDGLPKSFIKNGLSRDEMSDAIFNVMPSAESVWFVLDMVTVFSESPDSWTEKAVEDVVVALESSVKRTMPIWFATRLDK